MSSKRCAVASERTSQSTRALPFELLFTPIRDRPRYCSLRPWACCSRTATRDGEMSGHWSSRTGCLILSVSPGTNQGTSDWANAAAARAPSRNESIEAVDYAFERQLAHIAGGLLSV